MEKTFSEDFKKIFLLAFIVELIKHSKNSDISNLQKIIELEESKIKEKIPSAFPVEKSIPPKLKESILAREKKIIIPARTTFAIPALKTVNPQIPHPSLIIPEPKLPSHLEYLRPIPDQSVEIDLSKINPLIKDSAVRVIEGNPNERVIVNGSMGTRPTNIVLNKEDIDRIINKFSETAKIPVNEGIYKVVVGNLILSAVISEVVGSRFVIRKIILQREQPSPQSLSGFMPVKNSSVLR